MIMMVFPCGRAKVGPGHGITKSSTEFEEAFHILKTSPVPETPCKFSELGVILRTWGGSRNREGFSKPR
jgi:hypothetical protein